MGRISTFAAIALVAWCASSGVDATPPGLLAGLATYPSPSVAAVLIGGKLLAAKKVLGIKGAKLVGASLLTPILTKKAIKPLFGLTAKAVAASKLSKVSSKLGKKKHGKKYVPFTVPSAPPVYGGPTVYSTTVVKNEPKQQWPSEWPSTGWPAAAWPASSGWEWPSGSSSFGSSAGLGSNVYGGGLSYGGLTSAQAPAFSSASLAAAPKFQAAAAPGATAAFSQSAPDVYSSYFDTVKQAAPVNYGSYSFGKSLHGLDYSAPAAKPALTAALPAKSFSYTGYAAGGGWAFPGAAASDWPAVHNTKSGYAVAPTLRL